MPWIHALVLLLLVSVACCPRRCLRPWCCSAFPLPGGPTLPQVGFAFVLHLVFVARRPFVSHLLVPSSPPPVALLPLLLSLMRLLLMLLLIEKKLPLRFVRLLMHLLLMLLVER